MPEANESSGLISVVVPSFRDSGMVAGLLDSVESQVLPDGHSIEVIVVDDGNAKPDSSRLREATRGRGTLLVLPTNIGRSAARQLGAESSRGQYLFFVDADCRLASPDCVWAHLSALKDGEAASTGWVVGADGGFWHRYQEKVSLKRREKHLAGRGEGVGATSNLMVRRAAFSACGGFDVAFTSYGFEDTDLLLRLARFGKVAWADGARVCHLDRIRVVAVASKMRAAARQSAQLMCAKHPGYYRSSAYGRLDARLRPWLRPLAILLRPSPERLAKLCDALIERNWLPWRLGAIGVAVVSAMAYLVGSAEGDS